MSKIAFFELEGWEGDLIKKTFPKDELFLSNEKLEALNLPEQNDFEIISIFVNSKLDKKVIDFFPNLKYITTRSTGFDHIDLNECKNRNIAVSYVPGYGMNTVAEFAFGLILNLTRKMYQSIDRLKETGSFSLEGLRGMDIKGKTFGVIGTGRIGKEIIRIAKGFGVKIVAFDIMPDTNYQKEMDYQYLPLEELLKVSDIITIHTIYNKSTHHLINKNNIKLIKKGAYLVNTARGPIIETESIVNALKEGILAGYGADVLESEGEVKDELNFLGLVRPKEEVLKNMLFDHILIEMPNVLITPHNAFNTNEALGRILGTTLENIQSFVSGKVINPVE